MGKLWRKRKPRSKTTRKPFMQVGLGEEGLAAHPCGFMHTHKQLTSQGSVAPQPAMRLAKTSEKGGVMAIARNPLLPFRIRHGWHRCRIGYASIALIP